ncbi:MAG: hypothetical protein HY901_01855 [Deltaproteobacteria bacterium]|nr:hypothetical protein [Deltaproteobacteria bacterium]
MSAPAPVQPPELGALRVSAVPPAAAVLKEVDDPDSVWRQLVNELKAQRKDLVASALAHGRVLILAPGMVRLGYGAADGMYRKQAERGQKDAEAILSRLLDQPTGLVFESVTAQDTTQSMAEEDDEREKAREAQLTRQGREHPAVLAAMKILGATVEHVKVLEAEETGSDFAAVPEEPEETGREE